MAITTISHLTLTGLQTYDALIKEFIEAKVGAGIANSFKYVDLVEGKLNFYTVNPITNETVPVYSIELPEQDLSHLMALVKNATAGNVAVFGDGGQVADTGIKAADLAMKSEVQAVDAKADENAEAIAALDEKVGELPEGTSAKDVIDYVNIKTAGIATDAALEELQNQLSGLQGAVDVIEEDYLKAADKQELADAIAAEAETARAAEKANADAIKAISDDYLKAADREALQSQIDTNAGAIELLTNGVDAEKVDGVNDLIKYVEEHGAEVTGMKEDISENAAAIAAEAEKVATLQTEMDAVEGAVATKAEQSALDEEVEAREALAERVVVVEGKAHEHANAEVLNGITAEKVAAWDAAEANAIADAEAKNAALETAVKGYADGKDAETLAAAKEYADSKVEGVDLSGIATNAADIDKLEESLAEGGATYVSIAAAQAAADKAQEEVDALELAHAADKQALEAKDTEIEGNVTTLQGKVEALESVEHVEITTEQINNLFNQA